MCSPTREIQKKAVIDVAIFPRIILVNRRHVAQSCGCLLFSAAQLPQRLRVQRPGPRSKSLVEACSKSLSSPLSGRSPRPTPPLPGAPAQSDRVRSFRDPAPASEADLKAALERRAQTSAEADALRKLKSARRRQSRSRDLEGKVVIQDLEQAPGESSAAASKRITDEVKP